MQATVMTPLPGTQLFQRLEQEGRLLYTNFPEDWGRYDLAELVHRPKHIERAELWEVIRECAQRIYDPPTLEGHGETNTEGHRQLGGDGVRLPRQRRLSQRGHGERHYQLSVNHRGCGIQVLDNQVLDPCLWSGP